MNILAPLCGARRSRARGRGARLRAGHHRRDRGQGRRRAGPGPARRDRHRDETSPPASRRSTTTDASGIFRLPGLPVGRLRRQDRARRLRAQPRKAGDRQRRRHHEPDVHDEGRRPDREVTVIGRGAAHRHQGHGRRRDHHRGADREPAAERPPVRQPGGARARASASASTPTPPSRRSSRPRSAGGGGRNINYLIDGGDNNDDTVGGLVQNFPLDSIGEFNFETQRFRADTGRANGGTIKVVTKSGTNELQGLGLRATSATRRLNSQTETEKLTGTAARATTSAPVRRAAWAARSSRTRPTSSLSFERIQQDTTQAVEHARASSPTRTASSPCPSARTWPSAKITHQLNTNNYLSVRYGYNNNSQPYGAGPQLAARELGRQQEQVPLRER